MSIGWRLQTIESIKLKMTKLHFDTVNPRPEYGKCKSCIPMNSFADFYGMYFVKIRHFGLLSPVKTAAFEKAGQLLTGLLIILGMLPQGFAFPFGCRAESKTVDQNHLRFKHCGGRLILIEINEFGRGPPVPCLCWKPYSILKISNLPLQKGMGEEHAFSWN